MFFKNLFCCCHEKKRKRKRKEKLLNKHNYELQPRKSSADDFEMKVDIEEKDLEKELFEKDLYRDDEKGKIEYVNNFKYLLNHIDKIKGFKNFFRLFYHRR